MAIDFDTRNGLTGDALEVKNRDEN